MVFVGDATGSATPTPIGFATSHSLSITTNTAQVSTKDHGDFPATIAQNITWEVTCENLYSQTGESTYLAIMKEMKPVQLVFSEANNYLQEGTEKGVVQPNGKDTDWAYNTTDTPVQNSPLPIAKGMALITSVSVNAPAGDNATLSVTFTGTGELDFPNV